MWLFAERWEFSMSRDDALLERYRLRKHLPLYRVGRALIVPFFKLISAYEVSGRENVPRHGPAILAGTHRSYLDIPFMGFATRRVVHYMGKAELWDRKFSGWFCTQMGSFPVRRGLADRNSLSTAQAVLDTGQVLGIFPEGARRDGPALEGYHGGCVYLAQRTGAPIIPVAMHGTGNLMGADGKLRPFRKVRIKIGEAIEIPAEAGYRARADLLEELRVIMQAMYSDLRSVAGEPIVETEAQVSN